MCLKERQFQIMKKIRKSSLKMTKSQKKTQLTMTPSLWPSQKVKNYCYHSKKPYCKRNNKQTNRLSKEEVELRKAVTQRLTHSPVPKDEDAL